MPPHKRPLYDKGMGRTLLRDRARALLGLLPAMDCPAPVQRLDGDMAPSSPASGSSPRMRTTLSSSRQTSCAPAHQWKGGSQKHYGMDRTLHLKLLAGPRHMR